MFHNFLTNENRRNIIIQKNNKNNITSLPKNDIMPKYTNIKKEIKKRTNDLRKCFNIKNTIFKEMQSKKNSLTYRELMLLLGKYFFGPNGVVTEKYKFLMDYYEKRNLKIGLDNRIYAGTLDYFFLLSPQNNSYSKRLNFTKKKLLSLSNHLAIASSPFDKANQKSFNKLRYIKKNKDFVSLNKKNFFSIDKNKKDNNNNNIDIDYNKDYTFIKNDINKKKDNNESISYINNSKAIHDLKISNNNSYIIDTRGKTPLNLYNTLNEFNNKSNNILKNNRNYILKGKLKKLNNIKNINYQLNNNIMNITPETSLSNSPIRYSFFNNSIKRNHKYSNKSKINILKQNLKKMKSHNNIINSFLSSSSQMKKDDKRKDSKFTQKKIIEPYSGILSNNIKVTLEEKISPILLMNQTSKKSLSYIKYHHLNSKNEKKVKNIIKKKNIISILKDKDYFNKIKYIRTPNINSIELPNKIKNITIKKKYDVEFE